MASAPKICPTKYEDIKDYNCQLLPKYCLCRPKTAVLDPTMA